MTDQPIRLTDPAVIIAGIRQFGLAPDGSDLSDLEAAIERMQTTTIPTPCKWGSGRYPTCDTCNAGWGSPRHAECAERRCTAAQARIAELERERDRALDSLDEWHSRAAEEHNAWLKAVAKSDDLAVQIEALTAELQIQRDSQISAVNQMLAAEVRERAALAQVEALSSADRDDWMRLAETRRQERDVAEAHVAELSAWRDTVWPEHVARIEELEQLRPHWAQGYSDDSIAAQTLSAALSGLWKLLNVDDQTHAVMALKALLAQVEAGRECAECLAHIMSFAHYERGRKALNHAYEVMLLKKKKE